MSRKPLQSSDESLREWPEQVMEGKFVRLLEQQLHQLRNEDEHGNRRLFLDDVFVAYLLAFFTPSIRSLRTLEDFSQTRQAQKHLTVRQICKSTLSDFNQLANPARLEPILQALRSQLVRKQQGHPLPHDDLAGLLQRTIAVDGTFVPAVAEVAWALANRNNHQATRHRARLDARIHVDTWLPEALVVPEAGQSEADSAIQHLQPGRLYLYDRGYMSFDLLRAHYADSAGAHVQSHFVIRYQAAGGNSPALCHVQDRALTAEDRATGVISDRTGNFESNAARRSDLAAISLREVMVTYEEQGTTKTLRLVTNLFDVSAQTVALLYRFRWQVELFLRWFKSFGNFAHLISHCRNGVLTHLYVTIIAALLMYLHTGHRPSKYLFALLSQVAAGAATLEEILPILRERERRSELDRQTKARRRAQQKQEGT